jgi:hypothetical protein
MDQQEQINEIVAMLDQFMDEGGGHMNIKVDETLTTDRVQVQTFNSTACQQGMACQVPTIEFEGDDQYE